jgi:aconitate hydratase 2/2-methylisocitrate dehydratase
MNETLQKFFADYRQQAEQRAAQGIPPKPLTPAQTELVIDGLQAPSSGEEQFLLDLFVHRVPPGVDEAARLKAAFLDKLADGAPSSPLISPAKAVEILGTMRGGYNIQPLIKALKTHQHARAAAEALAKTVLISPAAFEAIDELRRSGSSDAADVMERWASAEWFLSRDSVSSKITVSVFKVPGETTTDDLSPAADAATRPDIPLHAKAMLKNPREGVGNVVQTIKVLKEAGYPVAFVGDVVGTGSSRKSATNSVLWHLGQDIPYVPNRRTGAVIIGGRIAPIFFNTNLDSGTLPIRADVSAMTTGDVIDIFPYEGVVKGHFTGVVLSTFSIDPLLLDAVRAGGRPTLIFGKKLTEKAARVLGKGTPNVFAEAKKPESDAGGYTLAQKILGKAIGLPEGQGVRPGQYIEPKVTSVGSQDTTGPMTRDELKDLACLEFAADLVLQSFCHTAAYPKPIDKENFSTLSRFMKERGGIVLKPGDGVIHSWLNRILLPDTVGTGGDSHTRFPIGLSFPGGSDLVAFAAATGVMPLEVPKSVLVRFKGKLQQNLSLRDVVNAIPYFALQQGSLTVEKKGKVNVFDGCILEIEGLPELTVEEAFELTDASAERSAAACAIRLGVAEVETFLRSNLQLLSSMLDQGYGDEETIRRRITAVEQWLASPSLLAPDANASYSHTLDIDLTQLTEPLLACPNDPDDVRALSAVAGTAVDEVFIGSCMTRADHFRLAAKIIEAAGGTVKGRLWIAPPTRMDRDLLEHEGVLDIFRRAGARLETPGCSLCMGNQATVEEGAVVLSTSTRNFPNRLGRNTRVFLGSACVAAATAVLGHIPTVNEYERLYASVPSR